MDSPLARYLTRFTLEPEAPPFEVAELEPSFVDPDVAELDETPAFAFDGGNTDPLETETNPEPDTAAVEIERRLENLRAELTAEAEAELAQVRAELTSQAAQDVEAARATVVAEQAPLLAARIDAALTALRQDIDTRVADVLMPLLCEATVARARADFSDAIARLLDDPDHPPMALHGPRDLLDAIRTARPDGAGLAYVVSEEIDARLVGAGMRIEMRLAEALGRLCSEFPAGDAR